MKVQNTGCVFSDKILGTSHFSELLSKKSSYRNAYHYNIIKKIIIQNFWGEFGIRIKKEKVRCVNNEYVRFKIKYLLNLLG